MNTQDKEEGEGMEAQITIPKREYRIEPFSASGAGGQRRNRKRTAMRLYFPVFESETLTKDQRDWVLAHALINRPSYTSHKGVIWFECKDFANGKQNREAAILALHEFIHEALKVPKERIATKPTMASKKRRRMKEEKHSEKKKERARSRDYKIR